MDDDRLDLVIGVDETRPNILAQELAAEAEQQTHLTQEAVQLNQLNETQFDREAQEHAANNQRLQAPRPADALAVDPIAPSQHLSEKEVHQRAVLARNLLDPVATQAPLRLGATTDVSPSATAVHPVTAPTLPLSGQSPLQRATGAPQDPSSVPNARKFPRWDTIRARCLQNKKWIMAGLLLLVAVVCFGIGLKRFISKSSAPVSGGSPSDPQATYQALATPAPDGLDVLFGGSTQ